MRVVYDLSCYLLVRIKERKSLIWGSSVTENDEVTSNKDARWSRIEALWRVVTKMEWIMLDVSSIITFYESCDYVKAIMLM